MRIFKYWVPYSQKLTVDDNSLMLNHKGRLAKKTEKVFTTYGGSNFSEDDAKEDAKRKLIRVQKIMNDEIHPDVDYEADIMEEILLEIDSDNIVTRNRYGAEVLNSRKAMFIDVDNCTRGFFDIFRGLTAKESTLKRIVKKIERRSFSHLGFRVYETFKGFRILVIHHDFNPKSDESNKLMRIFNADNLYRRLCITQNCYRARLTPKPFRINQKGIRFIFPKKNPVQEERIVQWIKEYNSKSENFASCKLVFQHGRPTTNRVIEYHDKKTKALTNYKLA